MKRPFKMKNSALKMAAKGAPMQKNYAGSPMKQYIKKSVSTETQGTENEDKNWSPRSMYNDYPHRISDEFAAETDSLPHNYTSHSYTVDMANQDNKASYARSRKYENNMKAVKPKPKKKKAASNKTIKDNVQHGGTAGKI